MIVLNQPPKGFDSEPLAVDAAEQLNWITVGLPGFSAGETDEGYLLSNPDSFYVIIDLFSRFTGGMVDIDMGTWSTEAVDGTASVHR